MAIFLDYPEQVPWTSAQLDGQSRYDIEAIRANTSQNVHGFKLAANLS